MHKLNYNQLAEYVKKAQQGDKEAFAMLYAATVESQLYFATVFLKDSHAAEDVVQDVYLTLLRTIGNLQNPQYFISYLNRICYNTCVDYKRKQGKGKMYLSGEQITDYRDNDQNHNPHDRYQSIEQSHEVLQALGKLPEKHRSALLMRYYQRMKIGEIAKAMQCSESTVKRYIKAALSSMENTLRGQLS